MGAKKGGKHVAVFTARAPRGKAGAAVLRALQQSLAPEEGEALPGASIKVRALPGSDAVEIRIDAESVTTLRAAVNSYLRAAALAVEIAEASAPD